MTEKNEPRFYKKKIYINTVLSFTKMQLLKMFIKKT